MTYRPDIDGLRAVAIIFVLFFHGGLTLFPSGFIGVDIFFVISGFLITSIIHNSLQKGHFSFVEFYNRRLWRLQPVFVCLLVTTLVVTLFFYLPEDLLQYIKSARKTSLFISNDFFQRVTTDYFSPNNSQLPLLHTWSLSIEWQCYLLLPIAIFSLYRIFGERHISKIIYLLTGIFFVLTLYCSVNYPVKTYYQLWSRIFEFLVGASVVFAVSRFSVNKYFLNVISIAAIATLFYIATRSNIHSGFPNGYALILCLATALLIAAGSNHQESVLTRVLSLKPLVFTGLISYSLYIWHWPLFALIRYLGIEETPVVLFCLFSLTFIIAYLSWRFIEKPMRQFNKMAFGYSLTCLFILPAAIIHFGDYVIKNHEGYPRRFKETLAIDTQLKQYASSQRPLCLLEKNVEVDTNCVLGAKGVTSKTGFMIGDSYSNHFWGFIDTLAQKADISILSHATVACLALPRISQYDWGARVYKACHEQTARYYNMIKTNHYDFVILGENWDAYLANRLIMQNPSEQAKTAIENSLDEALQIITASGAKPVLIKSIALSGNTYECFYEHIKQRRNYNPEQCAYDVTLEERLWQDDLFLRMQKKYTQLAIIDPIAVQCPEGRCKADINGVPVFRDPGHITDYAAYHFASAYLQHHKNPFIS